MAMERSQPWECAPQDKGYCADHDAFFKHLAYMCKTYRVSFLAGDFNMALFAVPHQMRTHYMEIRDLGSYAWLTRGDLRTEMQGQVRLDSMGLFAIGPAPSVEPWLSMSVLAGVHAEKKLEVFDKGQGFEYKSYVGGMNRVDDFLNKTNELNKQAERSHQW